MTKNRKWGPAIGHYDLALKICPDSGASHNQLAVIAWEDGSHLRAMYHLYRAVSARRPHPTSEGNLETELRKVFKAWKRQQLILEEDTGVPSKALIPYFIYLHARCYNGVDFPNHDELEGEVMNQLAVDLKERSLDGALQKIVLINIAAEAFAHVRSTRKTGEAEANAQGQAQTNAQAARQFFQRINVKTFFTLLQVLLAELERSIGGESENRAEKVTVVARRILPALRNYSSWLLQNVDALAAQRQDKESPLSVQIKEFWKIYANTLTLLTSTFDVPNLPEIDYLLEEDEDTLGFTPLMGEATNRRYMTEYYEGLKPRIGSPGIERIHPNQEMLFRIRDFVIDGLDLVIGERIPVALVDENDRKIFIYKEEDLPPAQFFHSPQVHQPPLSSTSIRREDIPNAGQPGKNMDARSAFGGSQSASVSMSTNMNGIVEGVARLVESDTYESAPPMTDGPDFLKDTSTVAGPPPVPRAPGFTPRDPNGPAPPVPPGLGPREEPQPAQSYTPRPTLPGIHTIWSTNYDSTPDKSLSTHGFPAASGTGPRPFGSLDSRPQTTDEPSPNYLELQRSLSQQRRGIDLRPSTTFDPSSSYPSVAAAPSAPQTHHLYGYTQYSLQSTSDKSWADRAFIASSNIPPGSGPSNSQLRSGHESAARYGVIGQQTPSCEQGG